MTKPSSKIIQVVAPDIESGYSIYCGSYTEFCGIVLCEDGTIWEKRPYFDWKILKITDRKLDTEIKENMEQTICAFMTLPLIGMALTFIAFIFYAFLHMSCDEIAYFSIATAIFYTFLEFKLLRGND